MASALLGIYLNDHLAGATAGLALFRRAASAQRERVAGPVLARLAAEVEEDRDALLGLMQALGVPVRAYKVLGGWALEKVGRAKPNGRLVSRSPLSDLVELEGLRLGVEGKAAGFRALRAASPRHRELDPAELDRLVARAEAQGQELEALRVAVAADVLG